MPIVGTPPFGSGFSPLLGEPRMGTVPIPTRTPTNLTLTTGGGPLTATPAQCLSALFVCNTVNAQTLNLPTAALLNAAIPSCAQGAAFDMKFVNTGVSTLTIAAGAGGTAATGSNSKSTVLTVATLSGLELTLVVTGVLKNGDPSDSYIMYGLGSTAAAVA
jgi:hypothetical protein